ncbi:quinol:cytochrome c oxidoreductase iron-sulfur protein precursor [Fodinibius salinus]|uniref:Quinol:cytochrome c oxidoreductase iron-sulfur protein n=1 Tax=Fodinibius salinus TaxID=860790 RepID=A0A5D3YIW3_9BACT|nr:TAT-variant-translocated molybdopterin oxidoreductase [Fodinibius salinus]TYP92675.1 quinol:cytochrome c oxidoreductase iron-sulfur protein precursor [Fodinibius salinus]
MSEDVKSPNYWKSLGELAKNDEYQKYVEREFPENATELNDEVSRRSFLRVMGASIALAGFAACRRPVQKIMPYSKMPEDIVPGNPLYYASAMPFQDALNGIVVENHEGRPGKIEGNEMHPASNGNTSIYGQAEILNMFDPDRSRYVRKNGERSSVSAFAEFCSNHFSNTEQNIAFVSEANSSPTYNRLKEQAMDRFSNAQWVTYEAFGEDNALEGTNIAFGQRLRTANHYDEANTIVSFDDDFLNPAADKNSVANTKKFTDRRAVTSTEDDMSRLYSIESTFTLTGSNADNRLRIKSGEVELFIYALAAKLEKSVNGLSAFSGYSNKFSDHEWIPVLAEDLLANRGESILTVGRDHSPELHATVAAMNAALGNDGETVTYHDVPHIDDQNNQEAFASLAEDLNNGDIDTVVLVGTNPVFSAPADLNFDDAISQAGQVIHLSDYYDETSKLANWHINRAHFLEAWGDGYSYTGTRSIIQPQIEPLYSGVSEIEFLSTILNGNKPKGYDLVQETWKDFYTTNFQKQWEQALHDGIAGENTFPLKSVSISNEFSSQADSFLNNAETSDGMELVIRADSNVFDGRFANNGWLQELPEPMTKITWDNVALMSKKTADELGVKEAGLGKSEVEVIALTVNGTTVELPAWVQPGHADDSITITVGYGREGIGRVANETGVDTYPLRTTQNMHFASDISVEKTGEMYEIACTQDHNTMEGRSLLRHATLQEYREDPHFSSYESSYDAEMPGLAYAEEHGEDEPLSIFNSYDEQEYPDDQPQWGMSIDLNACTGCGVCTIACTAENNIPVVGKREVSNGREMHWIRNDRYFDGDVNNPKALHQPVPCMHCEMAPCEQVCPVAATTHSEDGMNQMTYNRCIGTRYCANNCPYKVRRFNFFNYSEEFLTSGDDPEIVQMAMNPEVTVRFRGVMEKCTYCVQRVNRAKIETDIETNGETQKPEDGAVETACQQACPADAIYFGDLTDPDSEVVQTKKNNRNYLLLEELNTRPRTSYLSELSNPNPKLA